MLGGGGVSDAMDASATLLNNDASVIHSCAWNPAGGDQLVTCGAGGYITVWEA